MSQPLRTLEGVRIIAFTQFLMGPAGVQHLADLGADVLKVERPGRGDDTRHWGPPFHGEDAAYFFSVNRDRRSVALDLTRPEGRAVVARLVEAGRALATVSHAWSPRAGPRASRRAAGGRARRRR